MSEPFIRGGPHTVPTKSTATHVGTSPGGGGHIIHGGHKQTLRDSLRTASPHIKTHMRTAVHGCTARRSGGQDGRLEA